MKHYCKHTRSTKLCPTSTISRRNYTSGASKSNDSEVMGHTPKFKLFEDKLKQPSHLKSCQCSKCVSNIILSLKVSPRVDKGKNLANVDVVMSVKPNSVYPSGIIPVVPSESTDPSRQGSKQMNLLPQGMEGPPSDALVPMDLEPNIAQTPGTILDIPREPASSLNPAEKAIHHNVAQKLNEKAELDVQGEKSQNRSSQFSKPHAGTHEEPPPRPQTPRLAPTSQCYEDSTVYLSEPLPLLPIRWKRYLFERAFASVWGSTCRLVKSLFETPSQPKQIAHSMTSWSSQNPYRS